MLGLLVVAAACWGVTVVRMHGMDMGPGTDLGGLGWFAVVWLTMMAAMMLPSFTPMAVGYARGARSPAGLVAFTAGYLLAWAAFGALAYALVESVRSLDLAFLAWSRAGEYLVGGVILSSVVYEVTAFKRRSLEHCRDAHLLRRRPGIAGALAMGIEQGGYCVGCSGALMVVLFAVGVMSIVWMVAIAVVIAAEKLLPWRAATVGATAGLLAVLGVAVLLAPGSVPWLTIPTSM